jgi:hypothetical protein
MLTQYPYEEVEINVRQWQCKRRIALTFGVLTCATILVVDCCTAAFIVKGSGCRQSFATVRHSKWRLRLRPGIRMLAASTFTSIIPLRQLHDRRPTP